MAKLCETCDLPNDFGQSQLLWCRFIKMTLKSVNWDEIKPNLDERCKICVASGECGECTLELCIPPQNRQKEAKSG